MNLQHTEKFLCPWFTEMYIANMYSGDWVGWGMVIRQDLVTEIKQLHYNILEYTYQAGESTSERTQQRWRLGCSYGR